MTPDDALENVAFARAHTTDQQLELLKQGAAMLCDTRFSLLIVDRCGGCAPPTNSGLRAQMWSKTDRRQQPGSCYQLAMTHLSDMRISWEGLGLNA